MMDKRIDSALRQIDFIENLVLDNYRNSITRKAFVQAVDMIKSVVESTFDDAAAVRNQVDFLADNSRPR